ncbi:MAG: calcium/sodium antiporter [Clostridia bacterium]|nr:calcium/sodium antiporter [Clostridia bacterium]
MAVPILLFILGLILLIKGGDWFVDGSVELAHRLHVPELIIGATVVSIGTTLPEVLVSATGAIEGHGGIAYGNAIGSVICNTALISALTFAIRPCRVDRETFKVPVIFFFIAAAFYAGTAYISGHFARWTGIVLLCIFAAYMAYTVWDGRRQARPGGEETESPEEAEKADEEKKDVPMWQSILKLVIGAACIAVGANLLVDNGTIIATEMGVPESVIALTFVALGTSLPELATAITALVKGHSALSLGNIVGANLFNLVLVSGLATTIKPFYVKDLGRNFINGTPVSLMVDIPVMLFVMAFMTLPALKRGKLTRTQGIILLAVYAAFCVFQFAYK